MRSLHKLSVPISAEAEEETVALLESLFQRTACVETDLETDTTRVSVFLDAAPARATLKPLLPHYSIRKLRHENWAESWKRHFKPIEIGSKLLIKPGWSRRKPKPNQAVVVIDPGLSFGTGQHPTTLFCLEQIVAFRQSAKRQSFLDVGTGSGILAIAAVKLGYSPVHALEIDPAAVRIARANAAKNRVLQKLRVVQKDFVQSKGAKKFDLICANLLSDVLLAERDRLLRRLKPGGTLVLAGILRLQFRDIRRAYEAEGLKLVATRSGKEWQSGAFAARQNFPEK
jgi:ribosomal protein L11 methyltransferase